MTRTPPGGDETPSFGADDPDGPGDGNGEPAVSAADIESCVSGVESQCRRVVRPKEQRFPKLAHYAPFAHSCVVHGGRWGIRSVVGLVVGAVLFGVTSVLVALVVGTEPVVSSAVGVGEMALIAAGGVWVVVSEPWYVWLLVMVVYVGHEVVYQRYREQMKVNEQELALKVRGVVDAWFGPTVSGERKRVVQEQVLDVVFTPETRSIQMRERSGPPLWLELGLWSAVGLVVGLHMVVVRAGVEVAYLSGVPVGVVELVYVVAAVLVSRTLSRALIEDSVRFKGSMPSPSLSFARAVGWRLGARVPLWFAVWVFIVGDPVPGLEGVWGVVMLGTVVVGAVYSGRWAVSEYRARRLGGGVTVEEVVDGE